MVTIATAARSADRQRRTQKWPDSIWIVRHGQSAGNVARDAAEAGARHLIDIATRDVDVPLSVLGQQQADALSRWFAAMEPGEQPEVVLASPYVRALDTAQTVANALSNGPSVPVVADERLREKEFGILDRMTVAGIRSLHPALSEQRQHVGKFYFRPPGGESWCDVVLRLRSVLDTLTREYVGERVLIVAHQVVVNCFRYLFERMTEAEVLALDRAADVPNCGVTLYEFEPLAGRHGKLVLRFANFLAPLEQEGTPVTSAPDAPAAPKS
jgi:broad specificity phosphatase PhoE